MERSGFVRQKKREKRKKREGVNCKSQHERAKTPVNKQLTEGWQRSWGKRTRPWATCSFGRWTERVYLPKVAGGVLTLSREVPCLWYVSRSELCLPCPCWAFVKYPARLEQSTLLWCLKNILAKRDNAKAEWAKIRPSGAVWLGSCAHRLPTWHPPLASLPATVCLLRAQVACAEGEEVLLPLAPRGDDKCCWAVCVTATWSSMWSNHLKGYASPSADLHIKIKPLIKCPSELKPKGNR